EGCVVGPGGGAVQFGAECKEMLGHAPLAAVACLPERVRELLLCRGFGGDEFVDTGADAECCGLPESVGVRAPFDEKPGDLPAAVAGRVVGGGSACDRRSRGPR